MNNKCILLLSRWLSTLVLSTTIFNSAALEISNLERQINELDGKAVNLQRELNHIHQERLRIEQQIQNLTNTKLEQEHRLNELDLTSKIQPDKLRKIEQNRLDLTLTRLTSLNATLVRLQHKEAGLQQELSTNRHHKLGLEKQITQVHTAPQVQPQPELKELLNELNAMLQINREMQLTLKASHQATALVNGEREKMAEQLLKVQQQRKQLQANFTTNPSQQVISKTSQTVLDSAARLQEDRDPRRVTLHLPQADKHYSMEEIEPSRFEVEVLVEAGHDRAYFDVQNQRYRSELPLSDHPVTYLFTLITGNELNPHLEIRAQHTEQVVTNTDLDL